MSDMDDIRTESTIGERVKRLRHGAAMTPDDLAAAAGVVVPRRCPGAVHLGEEVTQGYAVPRWWSLRTRGYQRWRAAELGLCSAWMFQCAAGTVWASRTKFRRAIGCLSKNPSNSKADLFTARQVGAVSEVR